MNNNNEPSTSSNNPPPKKRSRYKSNPYKRNIITTFSNNSNSIRIPLTTISNQTDNGGAIVTDPVREIHALASQFNGWKLYFPNSFKTAQKDVSHKVQQFQDYLEQQQATLNLQQIKEQMTYTLNLKDTESMNKIKRLWPNFIENLTEQAEETINCIGIAVHNLAIQSAPDIPTNLYNQDQMTQQKLLYLQTIAVRIEGFGPEQNIESLKVSNFGRLIAVRGTAIRVCVQELINTSLTYKCSKCQAEQIVQQTEGIIAAPTSCINGCKAKSGFVEQLRSPYTKTDGFQRIRLQESINGTNSGRVPRSIEVEFRRDLVDCVYPGDDVSVTGILKTESQSPFFRKGASAMFKTFLLGISAVSHKNTKEETQTDFSAHDMELINSIKSEPCPLRLLVHSLCPKIFGQELIKAGLILGLFGGANVASASQRRTEAHVLIVGDPGLGKSEMLMACANASPKGTYICGNTSSSAGLLASVRHGKGAAASIEAGALVLADQGTCCIDELDKMRANHKALLEVMEQQCVSIAKAGVICTLSARASVLAAANPASGHYDMSKNVSENIRMNPALLSRFDLVFVLIDRPNRQSDSMLVDHLQFLHEAQKYYQSDTSTKSARSTNESLTDHLRLMPNEEIDMVPVTGIQKYIAFARKNIHPKLSKAATEKIKQFYLQMRQVCANRGPGVPVTTRQLEALIRLTQARARVDLVNVATAEHAKDVIEIVRNSMIDVFGSSDGRGSGGGNNPNERTTLDCTIVNNIKFKPGMSQATQVKKFTQFLQIKSQSMSQTIFSMEQLKVLFDSTGMSTNFRSVIDAMNMQGILLKKGPDLYKLLVG